MKRINDRQLLEMIDAGKQQQECAAFFGVSGAAVCKRLKRLRPGPRTAVLDKLTEKEERFALAVAGGCTVTDAALQSFDCTSRDSAKTIGHRLAKDADIQEAISVLMAETGLTRRHLITRLKQHTDHDDPAVSLKAVDMGLKLTDSYPTQKRMNIEFQVAVAPVTLERYLNKESDS